MLKMLLVSVGLLLVSCGANASEFKKFMPDNNLRHPVGQESGGGITQEMFDKILDAGQKIYEPYAAKKNEELVINHLWDDPEVNANACRGCEPGKVIVNQFGGLARDPHVINEGFTLVMCHELGHLYGGKPLIIGSDEMSVEGQADYYATLGCYKQIAAIVPELKQPKDSYDTWSHNKCYTKFAKKTSIEDPKYIDCLNSLAGGLSLGDLLASLMGEDMPKYETPDKTVVKKTLQSYPATAQCRLDTYGAGTLGLARPKCWFKN